MPDSFISQNNTLRGCDSSPPSGGRTITNRVRETHENIYIYVWRKKKMVIIYLDNPCAARYAAWNMSHWNLLLSVSSTEKRFSPRRRKTDGFLTRGFCDLNGAEFPENCRYSPPFCYSLFKNVPFGLFPVVKYARVLHTRWCCVRRRCVIGLHSNSMVDERDATRNFSVSRLKCQISLNFRTRKVMSNLIIQTVRYTRAIKHFGTNVDSSH